MFPIYGSKGYTHYVCAECGTLQLCTNKICLLFMLPLWLLNCCFVGLFEKNIAAYIVHIGMYLLSN